MRKPRNGGARVATKADEKAGENTVVRLVFCREVGDLAGELATESSGDDEE